MSERAGSFYVDLESDDEKDSVVTRPVSKIITSVITGLLSLLILAVAVFPAALSPRVSEHAVGTRVDAGTLGFACSQLMGANMDSQASWYNALKSYPVSDKQGRRLTMQEALQNGLFFVNYHGEGKGELFVRDKESDLYKEHSKTDVKTLEGKRNLNNCTLNGLGIISANGLLGIANGISGITQYIVQHSFDADLICTDVKNPTDDCFNLLKIIGGNGTPSAAQVANGNSNGGIIGVLTSSIYMTLVSLVFIFVAITFIWKAAIHRQFREAFAGLGWALISYFVGFMLLLHPALLAQAPLAASSTVATCVIGAFSGQNCMNDTDTNSDLAEGEESSAAICKSSVADASPSEHMEMVAGGLTCKIWKSFILNMYSQGSFGTSFDNLDTMSTDRPTNKILTDAGLNPEDYCVHLYTDGSIDGQKNGTLKTVEKGTSNRVCNLAAYQMYLETKVQSGDDTLPENGKADVRWYKVIDAAAANNGFWDNWGGSFASTNSKNGIALMAIIVTVLGSLILVITSLYANVYYISSAVLTSFAPIFLLIGVIPGRGRRIMLGWLEKIVSNVMKYIASAAFLVVTIAIYGAILESMGSIGMTLLFTILMTMALFMYRREIIDLIGRANLGGEQLSSRMTDRLGNTMHNGLRGTRDVAAAMAGGALGAKLAGGTLRSGGADAVSRELKRSRGFVGNIARQVDRENIANRGKLKNKESEARNQATEAKRTASNYETAGKRAQTEFDNLDKEQTGLLKESSEIEGRRRRMTHSDVVAQEDMLTEAKLAEQKIRRMPDATPEQIESAVARKEQMANYVRFGRLTFQIEQLDKQLNQTSDPDERMEIQSRINALDIDRGQTWEVFNDMDGRTFDEIDQEVAERAEKIQKKARYTAQDEQRLQEIGSRMEEITPAMAEAISEREWAYEQAAEKQKAAADADMRARMYGEANDKNAVSTGRVITARKVTKVDKQVSKARKDKGFVSSETAKKDFEAEKKKNRDASSKLSPDTKIYGDAGTELDGAADYDIHGNTEYKSPQERKREAEKLHRQNKRRNVERRRKVRARESAPTPPEPSSWSSRATDNKDEKDVFRISMSENWDDDDTDTQVIEDTPKPPVVTPESKPVPSRKSLRDKQKSDDKPAGVSRRGFLSSLGAHREASRVENKGDEKGKPKADE
jgi:hypothetical protein